MKTDRSTGGTPRGEGTRDAKLPYGTPKLTAYGNLNRITRGVGLKVKDAVTGSGLG